MPCLPCQQRARCHCLSCLWLSSSSNCGTDLCPPQAGIGLQTPSYACFTGYLPVWRYKQLGSALRTRANRRGSRLVGCHVPRVRAGSPPSSHRDVLFALSWSHRICGISVRQALSRAQQPAGELKMTNGTRHAQFAMALVPRISARSPNPSIERTPSGRLRLPTVTAHVER